MDVQVTGTAYANAPTNVPVVMLRGDDFKLLFYHPFGAKANITDAWIVVRADDGGAVQIDIEETTAGTTAWTTGRFTFATSGQGIVTIPDTLTNDIAAGVYRYDVQLIGTPASGPYASTAATALTVVRGTWQIVADMAEDTASTGVNWYRQGPIPL